jgi:hypothetical protein
MLFILTFLAIGFFVYFQQKMSNRNLEHFQKTRERYEHLLEELRKNKDQEQDEKIAE